MKVVFGASGHAKEIAFMIRMGGNVVSYFVDNDSDEKALKGIPIITEDEFFKIAQEEKNIEVYIGIGNNLRRKVVFEKILANSSNLLFPNLFYPSVIRDSLDDAIKMGDGNIFFPGVVLTTDIKIGSHNHFNSCTTVSHDCTIGNFNSFSPGVNVSGSVLIENLNFFGTGSTIINGIRINDNLIIGAGATVVKNLHEPGTYIGLPANKIK